MEETKIYSLTQTDAGIVEGIGLRGGAGRVALRMLLFKLFVRKPSHNATPSLPFHSISFPSLPFHPVVVLNLSLSLVLCSFSSSSFSASPLPSYISSFVSLFPCFSSIFPSLPLSLSYTSSAHCAVFSLTAPASASAAVAYKERCMHVVVHTASLLPAHSALAPDILIASFAARASKPNVYTFISVYFGSFARKMHAMVD